MNTTDNHKPAGSGPKAKALTAAISLPKGGGAVRGLGEKFAANPVTGTGSLSVPLAVSPGRGGFGPQLALRYDSGAGNGPFGFGWHLDLPSITRKTDKGLPRYLDLENSDDFMLSGAEDLVPEWQKDDKGQWLLKDGKHLIAEETRMLAGRSYVVRRYRPRIEGLFARIERWTREDDGDVHWRSLSKDNLLTLYGRDSSSRIADPEDASRIFSWLICESRDDKGQAILYNYKAEDGSGVEMTRAHQRNRGSAHDPRRSANRYLKRVLYGNRHPLLDGNGNRPALLNPGQPAHTDWMFELVLDYGELEAEWPKPGDAGLWHHRLDAFSSYRAGFEVRTARLCRRVLMFHHFEDEPGVGRDCLVRSTDFSYTHELQPAGPRNPIYSFLRAVDQHSYRRQQGGYLKRGLPPLEFEYTEPIFQDKLEEPESMANLPIGVDGRSYRWIDLHGEGIPGILTEQAEGWYYKRNLSPLAEGAVRFAALEAVQTKPNLKLQGGQAEFMDLAGDGQPDIAVFDGPMPGLYKHDGEEGWLPFRPFASRPNIDMRDLNLRWLDLDGDGQAELLICADESLVWYPSLAEAGFAPAQSVAQALDEERGLRVIFADGSESIFLADMSGDGLTDLVRIRNGEICYWPNLGYGRFGAKVTMDDAPHFDRPEQFESSRIRLADIDGSGTTDLIYLHGEGVRLYFNHSGNGWSEPRRLALFPRVDELVSIAAMDLLGNGTVCLVWSSPLPGDARSPLRYVNLMGGHKPHLLVKIRDNLGAETRIEYATSTKFYLQDRRDGQPWLSKLPFPVHVVERVRTFDRIGRNRFTTRYAYHHGFFDGEEREFRGFGMVEQWDTEAFETLTGGNPLEEASNEEAASHVPPIHTKTWYHTGIYLGRERVSNFFAGLLDDGKPGEYYREPGLSEPEARALLLPDSLLPLDLSPEEEREACRALKGAMLRQEIYALDDSEKAAHPYSVVEQNLSVRLEQPRAANRHAVFFSHPREVLTYHYERNPADPRIQHALTLEVDAFGNPLREVAIGYGRRQPDGSLPTAADRERQQQLLITYTRKRVTNPYKDPGFPDEFRGPQAAETQSWELTGIRPEGGAKRFTFEAWTRNDFALGETAQELAYEQTANGITPQRRTIEMLRTLYRPDDLGGSQGNDPLRLLALGTVQRRALVGESYQLAFTPGLLTEVFNRAGQPLLPTPAAVLSGQAADRGGYLSSQELKADGRFPAGDLDNHWWIPSGRAFFSPDPGDSAAQELVQARQHFFLPRRSRDPFGQLSLVRFDAYDLLPLESEDALGNRTTVGERLADGAIDPTKAGNDYRVLQAWRVMDPNRNRTQLAFDTLGMVVGMAVMGKPEENRGDSLAGFAPDLDEATLVAQLAQPLANPHALLGQATSRLVYDLFAYARSKHLPNPQPAVTWTLTRETHGSELAPGAQSRILHSFSYSDGFEREIQSKIEAEPGPLVEGGPSQNPRWVGSGWTIYNNKGKPVRSFEPFFSASHGFEFGVSVGVSPVLFYDPAERVTATLHPNHSWEKVVFDAWRQVSWDVNDTALTVDPATDPDVGGYFRRLATSEYLPSWHGLRTDPAQVAAAEQAWPDPKTRAAERRAAEKTAQHAATPTTTHADSLGRPFLTTAHNRWKYTHQPAEQPTEEALAHTRTILDIEGNTREVIDAKGRVVMRFAYDMLGNRIRQQSMEAGTRWSLNDVAGKPIRTWDSRGHGFRTAYDALRRPLRGYVSGVDPLLPELELLNERLIYGEQHPQAEALNLRGALHLHLDQGGVAALERQSFKGKPLQNSRRIAREYKKAFGWNQVEAQLPSDPKTAFDPVALEGALSPLLEPETFTQQTVYDALDRPILLVAPHTPAMAPSRIRPHYNEANLLEGLDVNLRDAQLNGQPLWTAFVRNIDYDAKGQRRSIEYGNGATTFYHYDPLTLRLARLLTKRDPLAFPGDCPQPPPAGWPGCQIQNLHYVYDPAGNISEIRDDAQQILYFNNKRVEPSADYRYDALYRLIEASGREHLGQQAGALKPPSPHSHNDQPRTRIDWSSADRNAMGRYLERYLYDLVGNFVEMRHQGSDPVQSGWQRKFYCEETSQIEDGSAGTALRQSNRLSKTELGNGGLETSRYRHDAHGNMTHMSHLGGAYPAQNLFWDHRDQLRQCELAGGGQAFYSYDAAGQRLRKVWEKPGGLVEERLYLGGLEIYRRRKGAERLERETLQILDDQQRIAMVETRTLDTAGNDPNPAQLVRYQLGNHLGSASLELDHQGQIISYEEYTPYGSSSYQAVRSQTETAKRYRYTGKERDEESGLYYHGARYYAPWLGRWTACDPASINSGLNLFVYCHNNPLKYLDEDGKDPTPDQVRFRQIFQTRKAADASKAHASTLVQAFKDTQISGSTVKDRLKSVLTLTGGNPVAPSANFDLYTIRELGTKADAAKPGTGDSGFRRELRDSIHFKKDAQGRDVEMHKGSSDQIGHFLTAVSFGFSLTERDNYISQKYKEEAVYRKDHPYASILRDLMSPTTDMQVSFDFQKQQFLSAMVGHEKVRDGLLVGSGGTSAALSLLMASPEDVDNFLKNRLDLIQIDDSKNGNSYQDLLLTWVGYRFGQHVSNGVFSTKEDASRWLDLMLTDKDLSNIQASDPFYADAQQMQVMLQQFRTIQDKIHPAGQR